MKKSSRMQHSSTERAHVAQARVLAVFNLQFSIPTNEVAR